jgi:hypothetical protein
MLLPIPCNVFASSIAPSLLPGLVFSRDTLVSLHKKIEDEAIRHSRQNEDHSVEHKCFR